MLDFRHETFFALCRIQSYTKTAAHLHMTQPAVSQHIRHLEAWYGCRLFVYRDKKLSLTPQGEKLYGFVQTMRADSDKIKRELAHVGAARLPVVFGATRTIGEYVMPAILARLLAEYPHCDIRMAVDNTAVLLEKLQAGQIDFALLEGYFEKAKYAFRLFSLERFIPICAPASPLAGQTVCFETIREHRLILREKGSGTRELFEQMCREHNHCITSFAQVCEVGNMSAIKQLVAQNLGISFLYVAAARHELQNGALATFAIEGVDARHEFNFVCLKDSVHQAEYDQWFDRMQGG